MTRQYNANKMWKVDVATCHNSNCYNNNNNNNTSRCKSHIVSIRAESEALNSNMTNISPEFTTSLMALVNKVKYDNGLCYPTVSGCPVSRYSVGGVMICDTKFSSWTDETCLIYRNRVKCSRLSSPTTLRLSSMYSDNRIPHHPACSWTCSYPREPN